MTPPVVTEVDSLRDCLASQRRPIGLVPTMGALHRGHTSLMDLARTGNSFVVASIFVNPTQFGPSEDLSRYPRTLEHDLELCGRAGVDLVFAPTPEVMYPANYRTFVEVTELTDGLCGASRPGHFRGVATVVLKLFNLVHPDRAYFGQKDAQQVRIIQQMVRDLDVPVEIVVGPTVREPDGLALSSRNQYLDADQRRHATVLYRALCAVKARVEAGERDVDSLRCGMIDLVGATPGAVLDYAELVDADSLRSMSRVTGTVLAAVAVRFGGTRLIDNVLIHVEE
jgi:pantoate--beta-alanine ligase